MNVPDGENLGAARQVGTDIEDRFCPAPIRRAQEYKRDPASCRVFWQDLAQERRHGAAFSASLRTGVRIRELLPSVIHMLPEMPPPESSR
jgi:hypothetical protein